MKFSVVLATNSDFAEILALQDQNHFSNLPENALAEGFVTTQLSLDSLEKMRANRGIWIVRAQNGELAAYGCANSWGFYDEGDFQNAVRAILPLSFDNRTVGIENSFQYGPICVAAPFRGRGALELLVSSIKSHYAPRFEFGMTFIDTRNARSLAAHGRKLNFRPLALLPFGEVVYRVFAFPTTP